MDFLFTANETEKCLFCIWFLVPSSPFVASIVLLLYRLLMRLLLLVSTCAFSGCVEFSVFFSWHSTIFPTVCFFLFFCVSILLRCKFIFMFCAFLFHIMPTTNIEKKRLFQTNIFLFLQKCRIFYYCSFCHFSAPRNRSQSIINWSRHNLFNRKTIYRNTKFMLISKWGLATLVNWRCSSIMRKWNNLGLVFFLHLLIMTNRKLIFLYQYLNIKTSLTNETNVYKNTQNAPIFLWPFEFTVKSIYLTICGFLLFESNACFQYLVLYKGIHMTPIRNIICTFDVSKNVQCLQPEIEMKKDIKISNRNKQPKINHHNRHRLNFF